MTVADVIRRRATSILIGAGRKRENAVIVGGSNAKIKDDIGKSRQSPFAQIPHARSIATSFVIQECRVGDANLTGERIDRKRRCRGVETGDRPHQTVGQGRLVARIFIDRRHLTNNRPVKTVLIDLQNIYATRWITVDRIVCILGDHGAVIEIAKTDRDRCCGGGTTTVRCGQN